MRQLNVILPAILMTACSGAGFGGASAPQPQAYAPYSAAGCMPRCAPMQMAAPANMAYGYNAASQPAAPQYATQFHHRPYQSAGTGHYAGAGQYAGMGTPALRGMHNPHAAQGYKYGTAGVIMYDHASDNYGIQGRAGYQSRGLFGAELEGSIGLTEESGAYNTGQLTRKFDNSFGAFGLARLPLKEKLSVHGRFGLHSTRYSTDFDDGTAVTSSSTTDTGLAYGIGAEYSLSARNQLRFDYTKYNLDRGAADSISLGLVRKF